MLIDLPDIGFGTWQNTIPEQCPTSVSTALKTGYTFIDTAQAFRNERYVGNGISKADVPRKKIIVANIAALELVLDDEDIQKIESITTEKWFVNPPFSPWERI